MSSAMTTPMTVTNDEPAKAHSRWRDLSEFLAVGGLTIFLFPIAWALRGIFGLDTAELITGFTFFHAARVLNDPHFAVTYLLFYRDARERAFGTVFAKPQRIRFLFAGVVAPFALFTWAVTALLSRDAETLGFMVQLMFLLVGWHYVKQGFGVMLVLAGRRGVRFSKRERFAILAHCYAGWGYAWANPFDPGRARIEHGVIYESLAHPLWLEPLALAATITSAAWLALVLLAKRRREGKLPLTTPLVAMLMSIWVWLIFSGSDPLVRYALPAMHSLQYLYFVKLLEGNKAKEREGPPHFDVSRRARLGMLFGSAVLLGALILRGLPMSLDAFVSSDAGFAETALGATPFFAAIHAFINLHHYFMDAVIWRRDNPETRYLFYRGGALK